MNIFRHPALCADWLVLRREGPTVLIRLLAVPVLLSTCCVALVCGDFYLGYGWCLAAGVLLALGGGYALTHRRLLDALERWRFGWCGALPTARGAAACTLLLVTAVALVVALALVAALLWVTSIYASHRGDLSYALAGVELALVAGTLVAAVNAFRRGRLARVRHVDGIRESLFELPWLNDPRLPHVLDWQRRVALVKWRRGGGLVVIGVALAALPHGPSIRLTVALVVLVATWSWLAVVMRACADAAAAALRLLGATPLNTRYARLALLRYPLLAASGALASVLAVTLAGGHAVIALAWIVCATLVSTWSLVGIVRATRHSDPSA